MKAGSLESTPMSKELSVEETKRFYRVGRKVLDREKSSHGHDPNTGASVYCEARSNHAAEVIQYALNSWHGMGPSRTLPRRTKKLIAKRKAVKAKQSQKDQTK